MFLFILESLSFVELAVIGIIALVILGPRRLPDLAKKAGKIMAEFRKVTNEFKDTWEREASIDDETKKILENPFTAEDDYNEQKNLLPEKKENQMIAPEVKEVSIKDFEAIKEKAEQQEKVTQVEIAETSKQNWL